NKKYLEQLKGGLDGVVKYQTDEKTTLENLVTGHKASADFLKKLTESRDVNEAYLFDVLDKWADSRRVKTKK
ncbi:MAG: hypothetical protein FWD32_02805, partial [Firmicutes bacterium]|nr:hypothetical protein [Bacillota bacterium]